MKGLDQKLRDNLPRSPILVPGKAKAKGNGTLLLRAITSDRLSGR